MTIKREFATFIAVLSALCASAGLTPRQKELLGHSLVHRGDGKGRPDNTMEALLYTWGRGYAPESDIRYTKDKVIVAFHDGKLKGRKISDWTWAELREEDVGSYRGAQYDTCRVPTWETIFTAMEENPSRRIFIDWKDVEPEKVAEMVKRHHLEKQCWFFGCNYEALRRYKRALPEGLTGRWTWTGDWSHFDFDAPGVLEKREEFQRKLYEEMKAVDFKDIDNVQVHCQVRIDGAGKVRFCPRPEILRTWAAEIKAAGKEASIYVESTDGADPVVYKRLWEMGFDSFGSDYPEAIYTAIAELDKDVVSGGMI